MVIVAADCLARAMARMSETTATAVGCPPAPWPPNTVSPPYFPVATTRFWLPSTRANGEESATRAGWTAAKSSALVEVSFEPSLDSGVNSAREICRIVQPNWLAYAKSIVSMAAIERAMMLSGRVVRLARIVGIVIRLGHQRDDLAGVD